MGLSEVDSEYGVSMDRRQCNGETDRETAKIVFSIELLLVANLHC
jgi:hypothetical protein